MTLSHTPDPSSSVCFVDSFDSQNPLGDLDPADSLPLTDALTLALSFISR